MLQYFVSIDVMGKLQVLHAGGGDECLQKEFLPLKRDMNKD